MVPVVTPSRPPLPVCLPALLMPHPGYTVRERLAPPPGQEFKGCRRGVAPRGGTGCPRREHAGNLGGGARGAAGRLVRAAVSDREATERQGPCQGPEENPCGARRPCEGGLECRRTPRPAPSPSLSLSGTVVRFVGCPSRSPRSRAFPCPTSRCNIHTCK